MLKHPFGMVNVNGCEVNNAKEKEKLRKKAT